ncbi:MAG: DUF1800 domain-containing protein [Cytophagales bacterium]|nr:DUF1800 domain-containing protein [Armatimonadota bacterium]
MSDLEPGGADGASRRDCLRTLGAVAGLAALGGAGCTRVVGRLLPSRSKNDTGEERPLLTAAAAPIARFFDRAAFGPTRGESRQFAQTGAAAWLDEQRGAPGDDSRETPGLLLRLRTLDVVNLSAFDLRDFPDTAVLEQLQQAAILRAVYSRFPLRERLTDFWTNHFNIYARKGYGASFKAVDDLAVIRKHALGTFPDLLKASAHSPAMLSYLDNPNNRSGVANENYARELMELHTLGVHGGYTQKDVQEVARCLTGWTIEDRFLHRRGMFRFDPQRHDAGAKTVLGVSIPAGGGTSDGDRVLEILAAHPSTARFIASKLVRGFYGEGEASKAATVRIADVYSRTGGSISAMLRALLVGTGPYGISSDLIAAPPVLKRPFDYLVSAVRVSEAETDGGGPIQQHLARMGQPLFQWPMPDGYPDRTAAWTGSLLARWNFAAALTTGGIEGTGPDTVWLPKTELVSAFLPNASREEQTRLRSVIAPFADRLPQAAALLLASPAFQWR